MNTEVVTQGTKELAAHMGSWGTEAVSASDVLIPKILLMQSLSEYVVDAKAGPGDLVDSVTGTVLLTSKDSRDGKGLEVIPIYMYKTIIIEQFNGSKWEYFSTEAFNPGDEKMPWEFETAGHKYRRNTTMNFYVLLATDAGKEDALPYLISFRRTSMKAGKLIATHFMKASMSKQPPASKTIQIFSKSEKSDNGPYQTFTAAEGRKTSSDEIMAAYKWYEPVKSGLTKVDTTDESPEATTASASSTPF